MHTLAGGLRGYEKSASHRFFIKYVRLPLVLPLPVAKKEIVLLFLKNPN
jgi:hypothetical protein